MKVIRAKSAGFCWGVERAINTARKFANNEGKPVYTDGPLIHNRQMMGRLQEEGIQEVGDYQSKSELNIEGEKTKDSVMVVRAHGISPERRTYLKNLGMEFKDATCPDVGIIAGKIRGHAKKGYHTVIFGDKNHPEVLGLLGYAMGKGHVIKSREDIDELPPMDHVCMVSQSTMFTNEFLELSRYLKSKYPDLLVFDTICQATKDRQGDVSKLAEQGAQAIFVIGGKHSANTVKLAALAAQQKVPTFHIETAAEIDAEKVSHFEAVGVTAGASTPDFLIDEVCRTLESI